jgi:Na+-driven multidrug efflux pump
MLSTQLLFVLLLSDNRQTWVMYINLTGAVLLLCINPAFIIWMGVEGAALTNVLIEAFVLVLYVRLARSTLGWVGLDVFKPLVTGAISIALYAFLPFGVIINLGIGTVFFVSTLFLFDIVRQQDIALLRETMASRRRKTGES